jgi:hypothetical protein
LVTGDSFRKGVGLKEEYPEYRVTFVSGGKYMRLTEEAGLESFDGVGIL